MGEAAKLHTVLGRLVRVVTHSTGWEHPRTFVGRLISLDNQANLILHDTVETRLLTLQSPVDEGLQENKVITRNVGLVLIDSSLIQSLLVDKNSTNIELETPSATDISSTTSPSEILVPASSS